MRNEQICVWVSSVDVKGPNNPLHTVHIAGRNTLFVAVQQPAFYSLSDRPGNTDVNTLLAFAIALETTSLEIEVSFSALHLDNSQALSAIAKNMDAQTPFLRPPLPKRIAELRPGPPPSPLVNPARASTTSRQASSTPTSDHSQQPHQPAQESHHTRRRREPNTPEYWVDKMVADASKKSSNVCRPYLT